MKITLLLLVSCLLTGCVSNQSIPTPSLTNSQAIQNTQINVSPTKLVSQSDKTTIVYHPSSTPTPVKIPLIIQRCMNFLDISHPTMKGRLVFSGYSIAELKSPPDDRSFLLDMTSGEKIYLGHTQFESVSPNGRWLAYYDIDREMIVVSDYNNNRVTEIPSTKRELTPVYWLDNQHLVIDRRLNSLIGFVDSSLLVLNPFTKEQNEWFPEFPNQNNQYLYDWQVSSNLVINPGLSQIIFPSSSEGRPLSLLDLSTNKIIQDLFYGNPNNMPRWSFNGDSYITSAPVISEDNQKKYINIDDGLPNKGGMDLMLVKSNGDIQRLTYYTVTERAQEERYIWSRDDQMIAFLQLDVLHSDIPELNVMKMNEGEIVNYCSTTQLPEDPRKINTYDWPPDPVWSSDSRFLAVTFLDRNYGFSVNIVELSSGNTWQIAKDASARGWLFEP
jgi:hypothetical protein